MSEYEAATLAFRTASLAAQHAGLWIAAAHVAVGVGQLVVVWYGIRAMQRAGDRRAAEQDQRHAESMRRLDALGVRAERSHAESMQAFDLQRHALETLIARTAPGAAGERT